MKVKEIDNMNSFQNVVPTPEPDTEITGAYCCDLLSVAMRGAPAGCVWCTVMNNINTLAVATLADAACVIICSGIEPTEEVIEKAAEQGICLYKTSLPIFEAALEVHKKIHGTDL